jgi:hypothetical protein
MLLGIEIRATAELSHQPGLHSGAAATYAVNFARLGEFLSAKLEYPANIKRRRVLCYGVWVALLAVGRHDQITKAGEVAEKPRAARSYCY